MPTLSRWYYKPVLNKLGGVEKAMSSYKFLGLTTFLNTGAIAALALNDNDANPAVFYAATVIGTAAFASNFSLLNKLGGMHIEKLYQGKANKGLRDIVAGRFQNNFGATLGAGAAGGLAMTGISALTGDNYSKETKQLNPNIQIQNALWIPLALNAAGGAYALRSFNRGSALLGTKTLGSIPKSGVNTFQLIYGGGLLKRSLKENPRASGGEFCPLDINTGSFCPLDNGVPHGLSSAAPKFNFTGPALSKNIIKKEIATLHEECEPADETAQEKTEEESDCEGC